MKYKYGEFSPTQIQYAKTTLRKDIFFLLLCVDPKTRQDYKNIDVNKTFENVMLKIGGMNELLFYPPEFVTISSLLQSAMDEYNSPDFNFKKYRKLILDAGSAVLNIKEVDNA